jgi:hypothetical protein
MKETFYFTHDYNARQDSKIKNLLRKHGIIAYGIYWAIIEDLYQNANALPTDYECIAFDLRTSDEMVKSIINDFDLFVIKDGLFGSLSVQRRIDERDAKSKKARDSAFARWNKDANALPPQSDSNAIKEKKEKENKEKENKENDKNVDSDVFLKFDHLKISIEENQKLIEAGFNQNQIDAVFLKIQNYRENKKYKSLYLTALDWLKRDREKNQAPQSNQMRSLDHLANGN